MESCNPRAVTRVYTVICGTLVATAVAECPVLSCAFRTVASVSGVCDIAYRSDGARRSGEILMRKVAALVALLGLAGWVLADGALLTKMASSVDSAQLARAEPLCPLC